MESERLKLFLIWAKAPFQRLLYPFGFRSSKRIAGRKFFFDPTTDIGLELLVTGQFEKKAIAYCANFIRPDSIVLDIGANIGAHTVYFADAARPVWAIC